MRRIFIITMLLLSYSFVSAQEKAKSVFDIARSGTVAEMKDAMKKNPNVINEINDQKYSPLILACYRGNMEVVDFLVNNVKDINYNSPMGTALMAVIFKGDLKLTQKLLDNKSDINKVDSHGTTPLIFATKLGNIDIVKLLIKYKAEKEIKDNKGKTAFEYAVFSKNQELINQLKK